MSIGINGDLQNSPDYDRKRESAVPQLARLRKYGHKSVWSIKAVPHLPSWDSSVPLVGVDRLGYGIETFANPFRALAVGVFVEICHLPDDGPSKALRRRQETDQNSSRVRDLERSFEEQGLARE